jgi:hypothetical protein
MRRIQDFRISYKASRLRLLALLGLLLLACSLILWQSTNQHRNTENEKLGLLESSVNSTATEIRQLLDNQRVNLKLLVQGQVEKLQHLLENPLDQVEREEFTGELRKLYPGLQAIMLTSERGALLLEDYRGVVDKHCKQAIRGFTRKNEMLPLQLHTNKQGEHYSLLIRLQSKATGKVVLLAQMQSDAIQQTLNNNRPGNFDLVMLDTQTGEPVAFANSNSDRTESRVDIEYAVYRTTIPGTQWELVTIPQSISLLSPSWVTALWTFSLLFLLGSAALWLLRRSDLQMLNQKESLSRQQRRLNNLQQTTISSELSFHEKIRLAGHGAG